MFAKKCCTCKEVKPVSAFSKKGKGLGAKCKKCNKLYLKKHYRDNPEYYKRKKKEQIVNMKEWFFNLKMGLRCEDCPEDHPACLDFHHVNPDNKKHNVAFIAGTLLSRRLVLEEIEKCIVLCANCHRKLHHKNLRSSMVEQ